MARRAIFVFFSLEIPKLFLSLKNYFFDNFRNDAKTKEERRSRSTTLGSHVWDKLGANLRGMCTKTFMHLKLENQINDLQRCANSWDIFFAPKKTSYPQNQYKTAFQKKSGTLAALFLSMFLLNPQKKGTEVAVLKHDLSKMKKMAKMSRPPWVPSIQHIVSAKNQFVLFFFCWWHVMRLAWERGELRVTKKSKQN